MIEKDNVIFDVSREDWIYKGILFAEVDNDEIHKMNPLMPRAPKDFLTGVMAMIWVDENGIWQAKLRFKYPSGNKMSAVYEGGKDSNETKILQIIYKMPMKNKKWYRNESGTKEGILEIMFKSNMIESCTIIEKEKI